MDEALEPPALERVDRHPFEREIVVAEHLPQARDDALRPLLGLRVGIRAELEIDAPDVVRLLVQQRRAAVVERRVEPEPALGREVAPHLHVGDEEAVFERPRPGRRGRACRAQGRARAVGGDHPIGLELVGAVGRLDGEGHAVVARGEAPLTRLRQRRFEPVELRGALHQEMLEVVLLEVDEGRHARGRPPAGGRRRRAARRRWKTLPTFQVTPFSRQRARDAEPVQDLEGALGVADAPRALADPVGIVEEDDRHAALREVDRRAEARRVRRRRRPPGGARARRDPDRASGGSRSGKGICGS